MAVSNRERINVIFPRDVLEELRRRVPRKHRSELIVQATAKELALLRQREALEAAAGAWRDEDYPDLNTLEDLDRFIAELRSTWRTRPIFETEETPEDVSS
ncbi:MAG: hypothetical protein HYX92_13755 [Chloroflexi bacterium]|nr:hypothetical protein [Chloroflexota bacterium]